MLNSTLTCTQTSSESPQNSVRCSKWWKHSSLHIRDICSSWSADQWAAFVHFHPTQGHSSRLSLLPGLSPAATHFLKCHPMKLDGLKFSPDFSALLNSFSLGWWYCSSLFGVQMRLRKGEWVITKVKQRRNAGHGYVSPKTYALVPARAVGEHCSCQRTCFQSLGDVDILAIFNKFLNGWRRSRGSQRVGVLDSAQETVGGIHHSLPLTLAHSGLLYNE